MLREKGSAQLEELARALEVSASTIRRDLEHFEKQQLVQRTHGGAIYTGPDASQDHAIATTSSETVSGPTSGGVSGVNSAGGGGEIPVMVPSTALTERMGQHIEAKHAIGCYAAGLVQPGMTVLLDGGSTVIFAARQITARPIQVVTHSLSIANHFADDEQVELLIVGGSLYPRTGVMLGPITTGSLADLHADLLLMSVAGIHGHEAYNQNLGLTQVEQAMMRQAVRSVLLMDSSKFGRKSLSRVCSLDEVDQIVTDAGVEQTWRDRLGDKLVVV